jgi:hypothetical protein
LGEIWQNNKSGAGKSLFVQSEKTKVTWKALREKFSGEGKGRPRSASVS